MKSKTTSSWIDLIKAYIYLLGNKKKRFLFLESILFAVQFYNVIPPLIVGKIVDFFTTYQKGNSLFPFYLYTFILGFSFALVSYIRLDLKRRIGNTMSDVIYDIRVSGFDRLLSLTLIENRQESTGEKAQKIQNGTDAFKSLSYLLGNQIAQSVTAVIGIFIIFLFLRPHYIGFLLFYVFGFFLILRFFYKRISKVTNELNQAYEKSSGAYIEGLGNILTIKALGNKESFSTHIVGKEEIRKQYEYKIRYYHNSQWKFFQIFNGLCIGIFLSLVGHDVINSLITVGSIVIFFNYLQNLTGRASDTLSFYEDLIQGKTAVLRMIPIFWTKIEKTHGQKNFPQNWNKLELKNATFNYPEKDKLKVGIQNVSLEINRSEKIGIVGKTGSGKSTLAKVLLGLLPLESETYHIGETNFNEIKPEEIFEHIGLVLQETEMFNLSLKENILLMKKVDQSIFEKALEISQLEEVIEKLPEGLETIVGEKGYHLSGGERQRIGLARVICKNPEIMILDEATSSLDAQTERKIFEALEKEFTQKTLIFITHKTNLLEKFRKIYKFQNGKIIE